MPTPEEQRKAYDFIDKELIGWWREFKDENSAANLYGLSMTDAVWSIHQKLKEMEL